jgi:dienelactone hydrolase
MEGRSAPGWQRRLLGSTDSQSVIHTLWPAGQQAAHAIVLLPAIAGPNDYVRQRAAHLADRGHAVVVIDYFGPDGAAPDLSSPGKINEAVAAMDDRRIARDVDRALSWLAAEGIERSRTGVLGFCIGGTQAVLCAARSGQAACAVAYYGQLRYAAATERKPLDPMSAADRLEVPLLAHFGTMDRLIGRQEIDDFAARLHAAGRHHELRTYPGAPHAFDEWFRPESFRPVASSEAWQRTLAFFDWHLRQRAASVSPSRPAITAGVSA